MKLIEITVAPSGQSTAETKGFVGPECQAASEFLEKALGRRTGAQLTSDFFAQQATQTHQQEGA